MRGAAGQLGRGVEGGTRDAAPAGRPCGARDARGQARGRSAGSHGYRAGRLQTGERLPANRSVSCRAPSPPGPVSFTPELDGGARETATGQPPSDVSAGAGPSRQPPRRRASFRSCASSRDVVAAAVRGQRARPWTGAGRARPSRRQCTARDRTRASAPPLRPGYRGCNATGPLTMASVLDRLRRPPTVHCQSPRTDRNVCCPVALRVGCQPPIVPRLLRRSIHER